MNRVTIAIVVILILTVLTIFVGVVIRKKQTSSTKDQETAEETPTEELQEESPTGLALDAELLDQVEKDRFQIAVPLARSWQKDSLLYAVDGSAEAGFSPAGVTIRFVFGSRFDQKNWFTVSFAGERDNYIRAVVPRADYLSNITQSVNFDYYKTRFGQALETAGTDSLIDQSDVFQSSFQLRHGEPNGYLSWYVTFYGSDGSDHRVIDAGTGQPLVEKTADAGLDQEDDFETESPKKTDSSFEETDRSDSSESDF